MPAVNPDILVWARETAGLTLGGAVTKIGMRDAHGVAAVDRLAALERGEKEPTRPVLVKMAQHYRRPLLAFYLAEPAKGLGNVLGGDITAARYHEQPSPEDAFALLRSQAEGSGVFVILKGDLGSYHTAIAVDAFRGFAIADDIAPFVVINDKDSIPAWSFTLLHELVHLLLSPSPPNWPRPAKAHQSHG